MFGRQPPQQGHFLLAHPLWPLGPESLSMPCWLRLTTAMNGVGQTNTDMVDSACFSLYFQDTASEAMIQRQRLNISRLEMNLLERRLPSVNCLHYQTRTEESGGGKEKGKKNNQKPALIYMIFDCTSKFNNMFLIFSTFAHYSLLALVKTKPPRLCGH